MARVATFLNFQDLCLNGRVCKAWEVFYSSYLDTMVENVQKEGQPFFLINRSLNVSANNNGAPAPINNGKDLKKRYAHIKLFSLDVANLFRDDFTKLVILSRLTAMRSIQGRAWMGLYSAHFAVVREMRDSLGQLATQRKICMVVEGKKYEPESSSHLVGCEESASHILGLSIVALVRIPRWISIFKNPENTQELEQLEVILFENLSLPFFFLNILSDKEIVKYLKPKTVSLCQTFVADPLMKQLIETGNSHQEKGSLTANKEKELRRGFVASRHQEILLLCKSLVEDLVSQFAKNQIITSKTARKTAKFLAALDGVERERLYYRYLRKELVLNVRNAMWAANVRQACFFFPKELPHVLFGGASHLTKVFSLLSDGKDDEKQLVNATALKSKK